MDIKEIILIIFGIMIFYLFYKTIKLENFETTDTSINNSIVTAVNGRYTEDIDAIRNLGAVAKKIMNNNDNLTLPTNINIPNSLTTKDLNITGSVNLFPKGSIIMFIYDDNQIPSGWVKCDGRTVNGVVTPDLRGRFPLGMGAGTGLTPVNAWSTGGTESHILTVAQMPSHAHSIDRDWNGSSNIPDTGGFDAIYSTFDITRSGGGAPDGFTFASGGSQAHPNMPPWHAVNFIMRVI